MTFPIFDLHLDSILQHRLFGYDIKRRHRAKLKGQPLFWHADLPRLRDAGYRGACLGVHYWPVESEKAWKECLRQLDVAAELIDTQEDVAHAGKMLAWRNVSSFDGLALTTGVEGAHMLNGDAGRIEVLARRGVSYLTLTHFSRNKAAVPSMGRGADRSTGLSAFGRDVVLECERTGIAIDVAHVNKAGVLDVCAIASRPVLCTHTGVCRVHPHARNITDEEIDAIVATGGVIGIIFGPIFLAGKLRASSEIVADHIAYVAERAGIEHVAIGTDFDGWLPSIPNDMRDCRDLDVLRDKLVARGFSEESLKKVGYQNAIRVFRSIEASQQPAT